MSINNLAFNSLTSNLVCCTDQGYIIYSLRSNFEKKAYVDLSGGVGMAKILDNTNMMVLVGGGTKPFKPKESFILYDQRLETPAIEIDMKESIKNILLTKQNIIVILEKKIAIFSWDGDSFDTKLTHYNPNGICVINPSLNTIVTLGTKKGDIAIWNYKTDDYKTIEAHNTNIESLTISNDGLLVATCSEIGSLIRVFDTKSKLLKAEFRRGSTSSTIYDLAFNYTSTVLACCSSRGTIHFFDLNNNEESRKNTKSFFTGYGSYISSYFDSNWSFKQISIGNTSKAICSFDEDNDLHIVTYNGLYYKIGQDQNDISVIVQGNLHINNK